MHLVFREKVNQTQPEGQTLGELPGIIHITATKS